MTDLSAQHYLDIYRTRLKMVDDGITQPPPEVVAGSRALVSALCEMRPDAKVRIELRPGKAIFRVADTGALIAEIPIGPVRSK